MRNSDQAFELALLSLKKTEFLKSVAMDINADWRLILLLQQSDVVSFDALYCKYQQQVYANIFKLTKDAEITKDILQEVFVTLWEKRATIDAGQSVAGWLFKVSYNRAVDHLKKALKESVIQKELRSEIPSFSTEPSNINIKELRLQLLEEAIEQLSPQKKKVFVLCKMQGKTYEESAKELNISKHTVKEYLSGAIANVYEYIQARLSLPSIAYVIMILYNHK
jgi:RNA polymerase sigma-70 factor (ECF subfamily)